MDFRTVRLVDLAEGVRSRRWSARELVSAALDRIESLDADLGAFVLVDGERSLAAAGDIDAAVAAGGDPGPLAGVPVAVKDVMDVSGLVTTHGSALHRDDPPATEDHPLVERLRSAGAVVVGKTNTPEHGWKADTDNPSFGRTANPWSTAHSAGGSSGGTAAALAAGLVPLATGSDGGGSIRIPASVCGLAGFKPTLGRVPNGSVAPPGWWFLSTSGPMAATLADTAVALDAVVGPHPRDVRSSLPPWRPAMDVVAADLVPRRIAWSSGLGYARADGEVRAACETALRTLEADGAEVVEVDLFDEDPVRDWLVLSNTCNLRSLARWRHTDRWGDLDPQLRTFLEWAESLSGAEVVEAGDRCHHLAVRLAEVLADADVVMTPTTVGQTPVGGGFGTVDGEPEENWVAATYPFNMTSSPAGTVPVGLTSTSEVPIGLQVVGPHAADEVVLATMAALERRVEPIGLAPGYD